jgi:hypothetical protein
VTRSHMIYWRKATPSIRGNPIVTSVDGNVWVKLSLKLLSAARNGEEILEPYELETLTYGS